jgi:hypothetical protein
MEREIISGAIGGAIGGLLTSKLMKIPRFESKKEIISKQTLNPGASTTLKPATPYKFAIVLFHGDGDLDVKITVKVGATTTELLGDEQAIEVLANETIEITATNTNTTEAKSTMTIEILSLAW